MKRYILVIDIIGKNKLELSNYLKSFDVEILHVTSSSEAINKVNQYKSKIKLIVWSVYENNNLEFDEINRFKTHQSLKETSLMIISTSGQKRFILKAAQMGISNYIVRPFGKEDIIKKISEIIVLDKEKLEDDKDNIFEYSEDVIFSLKQVMGVHIKSAVRGKYPLSMIMVSVGSYLEERDTSIKDILHAVIKIIRDKMRETDLIIRYGLDNALMILPFTDEKGVEVVNNKIAHQLTKNEALNKKAKGIVLASSCATVSDNEKNKEQILIKLKSNLEARVVFH